MLALGKALFTCSTSINRVNRSVQFSYSVVFNFLWSHGLQHARPPCPSPTPGVDSNSSSLLSVESVMPFNHLILCHPLLLLPSIFPSIKVFSSELVRHIRWPKYWSFSFNISPSNEYLGLISFRMDWLDLLVVQGTLKSLLQHYSSKASILRCSAFFIVQLSHPYMTAGKTISVCESKTSRYTIWIYKRQTNQRSNYQHLLDYRESKGVLEKHLLLLHWLCWRVLLGRSQQFVENS